MRNVPLSSQVFEFSPGVRLRTCAQGRTMLLVPEGIIELNDTASAIFELVDGRRTTREIAEALEALYDVSQSEIEKDVYTLCSELLDQGYLAI